jgi:hypothetical protein
MWPVFRRFSGQLSGFDLSNVQWSRKQPRHLDNLILENNLFSDFQVEQEATARVSPRPVLPQSHFTKMIPDLAKRKTTIDTIMLL